MNAVQGRFVAYHDGGQPLEGYLASPTAAKIQGGVLIAPTWLNINESIRIRADRLAELGYATFVLDVFGAGVRPTPPQAPGDVILPFMSDRPAYRRRLLAGLEAFQAQPECDSQSIAAVGYCFGGCGVLELARSGASLRGVVSLHGILGSPLPAAPGAVRARVLVLHGDTDLLVPFESVIGFRDEMRQAEANWEITVYGDAKHSFTGEGIVGDKTPVAALHPQTEARSWQTTVDFLQQVLRE